MPDYFDGELTDGTVAKAEFSIKNRHPVLVIVYKAGSEKFTYTTNRWSVTKYERGQAVTLIYNPSNPAIVSIYAVIGYWIKWDELLFTAIGYIILFVAAVIITGKNEIAQLLNEDQDRKRKYDD